ncbi:hypothetical protein KT99_06547 [Shewanella benthica KT99]|uniref:Uncharacterized protein n=1 Tax=Shewanella benthica KT99 TaxID=314608 RepID=A9CV63_9GAMM|nr:hypothetical protein KT99_06547 [Shewanella benthica KT99]
MDGEGGGLYMEVVIPDRRESDGVGFIGRDNAAKTIGFHSFDVGAASAAKTLPNSVWINTIPFSNKE